MKRLQSCCVAAMLVATTAAAQIKLPGPATAPVTLQSRIYDVTVPGAWNGFAPAIPNDFNDDWTQIQRTIDFASDPQNGNGGAVFIPAGDFDISRSLTISANGVLLLGEGLGSRIRAPRTSPEFAAVDIAAPGATPLTRVLVQKLAIVLNLGSPTQRSTSPNSVGIRLYNVQRAIVRDVLIIGFGVGMKLDRNTAMGTYENIHTDVCDTGLLLVGGTSPYAADAHHAGSVFSACRFAGYGAVPGVYGQVDTAYGVRFAQPASGSAAVGDVHFRNCETVFTKTGFKIEGPRDPGYYNYNVDLSSCGFDFNGDYALDVTDMRAVRVTAGYVFQRGFRFTRCAQPMIEGVHFSGTDDHAVGVEAIDCTHLRVVGCAFDHIQYGVTLRATSFSSVTSCCFDRNRQFAVLVDAAHGTSKYNVVGNCTIRKDPAVSAPTWFAIREVGYLTANFNRFADNMTDGGAESIVVQSPGSSKTP